MARSVVYHVCIVSCWTLDVVYIGHKPYKINFSSDYFGQLYEWAVELVKR